MLTAGSVRDTNYVHTNLKVNNNVIVVRLHEFGKTLQLPYSKGYSQGIWTLGYVKGTYKGQTNLKATHNAVTVRLRSFEKKVLTRYH